MTEEKEKKETEEKAVPKEETKGASKKEKEQKEEVKEKEIKTTEPASDGKAKKKKKINRMKLAEVEKHLENLEAKGAGLSSLYARHLLERKSQLQAEKESSLD